MKSHLWPLSIITIAKSGSPIFVRYGAILSLILTFFATPTRAELVDPYLFIGTKIEKADFDTLLRLGQIVETSDLLTEISKQFPDLRVLVLSHNAGTGSPSISWRDSQVAADELRYYSEKIGATGDSSVTGRNMQAGFIDNKRFPDRPLLNVNLLLLATDASRGTIFHELAHFFIGRAEQRQRVYHSHAWLNRADQEEKDVARTNKKINGSTADRLDHVRRALAYQETLVNLARLILGEEYAVTQLMFRYHAELRLSFSERYGDLFYGFDNVIRMRGDLLQWRENVERLRRQFGSGSIDTLYAYHTFQKAADDLSRKLVLVEQGAEFRQFYQNKFGRIYPNFGGATCESLFN